jgi:hypothetical protein
VSVGAPEFLKRMAPIDGGSGAATSARVILQERYAKFTLDGSRRPPVLPWTWNALRPMRSKRQPRLERRLTEIEGLLSIDRTEDPVFEDEDWPLLVHGRARNAKSLLFVTKPDLARRVAAARSARQCLILSKFGILSQATVNAIRLFANALALPIGFVGDLDVHDVAAFVAFRRALADGPPRQRVKLVYAGVSVEWLERHLGRGISLTELSFEEGKLERQRWELIKELWPRVRSELGASTASLLDRGYKVEVEVLYNPALFKPGHFEQLVRHLVAKARPQLRTTPTK